MKRKNKNGVVKLGHFILGVMFVGIMLVGWGSMMTSMNANYNISIDTTFLDTYNKLTETNNLTEQMKDKVVGAEIDDADPSQSLSVGMLDAVRLIFDMPVIIFTFFKDLVYNTFIPLDPQMQIGLLALIILAVTLSIIGLIYGDKII